MKLLSNIILVASLTVGCASAAGAMTYEGARQLYLDGQYEKAEKQLVQLVKKSPRDGNANYYLGASRVALGNASEAIKPLEVAGERGVADAWHLLAKISFDSYNVDAADEYLENWAEQLRKNKKNVPDSYDRLKSQLVMMRNMLERVEQIEVVDSMIVDADDFFEYYRLAAEAGKLIAPDIVNSTTASVVYVPQNAREILWADTDSTGVFRLMSAGILDDGRLENPSLLDPALAAGSNANYPFLMSDGQTLYFASDGPESLGGYDIFLTRRSPEGGFYEPQNLGMPYNSPYDDYMLAIDETTGAGWWATDRLQIPGKVAIYIFRPSQVRVNADTSDPNLTARALVRPLAASKTDPEKDNELLQRIATIPQQHASSGTDSAPEFAISLGNGKIYRSMSDFRNPQARREMENLLHTQAELRGLAKRLRTLRSEYAAGKKKVGDEILRLEKRQANARQREIEIRNTIIRLER